jgi:hypothetical protein
VCPRWAAHTGHLQAIRKGVAPEGSVILAFAGNGMDSEGYRDNCIVYAAVVSRRVPNREYYSKRRYSHRRDCSTNAAATDTRERPVPSSTMGHAILSTTSGGPSDYPNAALLSDGAKSFRYFGTKCPVRYKRNFPRLGRLVERLTEGDRVNHDPDLYKELLMLKRELWKARSAIARTPGLFHSGGRCDCSDAAIECGGH